MTQYDQCTETQTVIGQDTIQVAINLVANGPAESSVSHGVDTDEQGNRFVSVFRSSERPAGGTISFDGDAHAVGGVILEQTWRTTTTG